MKILFVTYDFPYPDNSGGKTRALNMIKYGTKGFDVHLFSFIRKEVSDSQISQMKKIGVSNLYTHLRPKVISLNSVASLISSQSIYSKLYFSNQAEDKLISIIKDHKINIVHFESYYTGFYIYKKIKNLPDVKVVYGSENIEYKIYQEVSQKHKNISTRIFTKTQVEKIKKEENLMMENADLVLAVNYTEANYIKNFNKNTEIIPNGTDVRKNKNKLNSSDGSIMFVGNFTYYPNIDALEHFLREILPEVKNLKKIVLVGKDSSRYQSLNFNGIKFETHEFIDKKDDLYNMASVLFSPVRIGGGTNFKVIEAMSYGLPVVAYSSRIESFGFKDGLDILSAKDTMEFIFKLNNILIDPRRYKILKENSVKKVEDLYTWENIGLRLNKSWWNLVN